MRRRRALWRAFHGLAALALAGGCSPDRPARSPVEEQSQQAGPGAGSGAARTEARLGATRDERPPLAVERGQASYYGDSLAGHRTASGEPYDPRALTAAHRTLPLGTVVRVTRVDTGVSVVVRITDRGPFGSERRILDLSRAAATRLAMIRAGVAEVRLEVLEYGARRKRRR
jgi:rare lipoprotein A